MSGCFNRYSYDGYVLALYALVILLTVFYLGVLIALCVVRKKVGAGKRLIGLPFTFALFFVFVESACGFISTTLQVCDVSASNDSYYHWQIASFIFYGIRVFLLLFVVIWTLNMMLREQLGHNPSALKIFLGLDLFVLGGLLASTVAINCYMYWLGTEAAWTTSISRNFNFMAVRHVNMVFRVLYLISILASGTLSILAVRSLKKKHMAGGSLLIWVSALIFSLFAYSLILIIQYIPALDFSFDYSMAGSMAMYWIDSIFHAFAFIAIIIVARNAAWGSNRLTAAGAPAEQQYDSYTYQQDPIYVGGGQRV